MTSEDQTVIRALECSFNPCFSGLSVIKVLLIYEGLILHKVSILVLMDGRYNRKEACSTDSNFEVSILVLLDRRL